MKKRVLSCFMALVMMLSLLPMSVLAAGDLSYEADRVERISNLPGNSSQNDFTVASVIWKDAEKDLFYLAVAAGEQQIQKVDEAIWHIYGNNQPLIVTLADGTEGFSEEPSDMGKGNTTYWCITELTRDEFKNLTPTVNGDYSFRLDSLPGGFKLGSITLPKDFVEEELVFDAIKGLLKVDVECETDGHPHGSADEITYSGSNPTYGDLFVARNFSISHTDKDGVWKITLTGLTDIKEVKENEKVIAGTPGTDTGIAAFVDQFSKDKDTAHLVEPDDDDHDYRDKWEVDDTVYVKWDHGKWALVDEDADFEIDVVCDQRAYSVTYDWGDTPENVFTENGEEVNLTLPVDNNTYKVGVAYPVDSTYEKGDTVYTHDQYGNKNGKYTFSGWDDPSNGTMVAGGVKITGKWTYEKVGVTQHTITINYVDEKGIPLKDVYSETKDNGYKYSFDVSKDTSGDIPFIIVTDNDRQYVFNQFTEGGNKLSGKLEADVTITAQYLLDSDRDGTPDDYQATVTFKVENGTWSDGSTDPKTETFPLKQFNETTNTWDDVTPAPTLGDKIPTEMKANEGYGNGAWNESIPTRETKVTGDATYTYTFSKQQHTITINYVDESNTLIKTAYNDTQSNGYNYSFDVSKDTSGDIPFIIVTDNDRQYVFNQFTEGGNKLSGKLEADVTITAQYLPDTNKNNVPDKYEATVTFKVENGTWEDGTNTEKQEVFALKEFDEETNTWVDVAPAPALGDKIPTGMKANEGYGNGAWDPSIAADTLVKNGEIYTYRYAPVPVLSIDKELLEVDGKPYTSGTVTSGQVLTYQITVKNAGKADARGSFNVTDSMWRDRTITDYKVMVKDTNGFNDYTQAYPMNGGTVVMRAIAAESEYVFTYKYTVQQSDEGKPLYNKVTLSISGQEWIDEVTVDVVKSTCTIEYSYESGTKDKDLPKDFLMPPASQIVKVGDEIQLPKDKPETTEYVTDDGVWKFLGWRSGGTNLNPPIIARDDMKIVGLWVFEEATYTLTYDANGGDANSVPTDSNKYTKGAEVELNTDKVPTHADVDNTKVAFIGWSTEQVDKIFGAGEDYTDTTAMVTINENTIVYAVWGYDRNGDEIADAEQVVIAPADITIYTGGEHSYDGVVDENGNIVTDSDTSGFPDPGFTVTLPYDLKHSPENLSLQFEQDGKILKWSFVKYSAGDHNVYRIEPADGTGTRPVRMQFTNHSTGDIFTSDTFEIERNLNQTLDMEVYGDGIEAGDVVVSVDSDTYTVATAVASLTVRGTTDHPDYGKLNKEIVEDHPGLTANENTTFTINDSEVEVKEDAQIALLFDDIIENNDVAGTNTDLLEAKADKVLKSDDYEYEFKYLDLVDTNNGNAWVAADQDVTVSWPLPEGTDKNTKFTVLHFEGLHREMGTDTIPNLIDTCKVETVKIVDVSDTHVTFKIGSAGFSPFALAWDNGNEGGGGGGEVKPPVLDKENHYGYIVGYTDDTVRPNGDITRAEVATIFFRLLTDESRDQYWSQTNDFSDVAADKWYNNAISTLTNAGILDGYEDGTFRPDGKITRAEFATIAVRFFDLKYEGEDLFPDIANHWARDYINQAAAAGFVNGYEDDTFRPDNPITRAEAVTLVNRTLERKPHKHHMLDDEMITWSDNMDKTVWYYEAIQEATNSHEYYMEKNDQNVEYEVWTKILPMRDWPALEKEWSQSNGGK